MPRRFVTGGTVPVSRTGHCGFSLCFPRPGPSRRRSDRPCLPFLRRASPCPSFLGIRASRTGLSPFCRSKKAFFNFSRVRPRMKGEKTGGPQVQGAAIQPTTESVTGGNRDAATGRTNGWTLADPHLEANLSSTGVRRRARSVTWSGRKGEVEHRFGQERRPTIPGGRRSIDVMQKGQCGAHDQTRKIKSESQGSEAERLLQSVRKWDDVTIHPLLSPISFGRQNLRDGLRPGTRISCLPPAI
jgi:hypothetical protein